MSTDWRHINLMLLEKGEKHHYTHVEDLSTLRHDQDKYEHKKHSCLLRCLTKLGSQKRLDEHEKHSEGINKRPIAAKMPQEGKIHHSLKIIKNNSSLCNLCRFRGLSYWAAESTKLNRTPWIFRIYLKNII